jgi:HEAT repeat protein
MGSRELHQPGAWSLAMILYDHNMQWVSVSATIVRLGALLVGMVWLAGCHSSAGDRSQITSPYPLDRVRAAVRCAEAGNADAVDLLIELLADRDRGVRMYSILALEQLCGEDYGYRYYAPEPERAAAIARWREARQRGEVTVRAPSPRSTHQSAAARSGAETNEEQSP